MSHRFEDGYRCQSGDYADYPEDVYGERGTREDTYVHITPEQMRRSIREAAMEEYWSSKDPERWQAALDRLTPAQLRRGIRKAGAEEQGSNALAVLDGIAGAPRLSEEELGVMAGDLIDRGTVQRPGESYYSVAKRVLGGIASPAEITCLWKTMAAANGAVAPYTVHVGERLITPENLGEIVVNCPELHSVVKSMAIESRQRRAALQEPQSLTFDQGDLYV